MYRRAVGSPFAEAILPFFRQIAGPLDLEVIPLRVVAPPPRLPIEGPQRVFTRELEKPGETEPRQVGNDNGAAERHRSATVP